MSVDFEQRVADVEAKLRAIVDSAVDGIITIDDKGLVLTMNPSAADLFGYEIEAVIGKNVSMLMPSPHAKAHDGYIENYKRTGEARIIGIGRQVDGLRKDGSTFPFKLSVSEVLLGGGTIFTGIIHDISAEVEAEIKLKDLNSELERKVNDRTMDLEHAIAELQSTNVLLQNEVEKRRAAEQELMGLLEKEKQLNELKSRFVSMASHEFRTPLGGILSSAELIARYKEEAQDEKRLKHVNRIRSAVGDLTVILDDFLSLDKLQTGAATVEGTDFDVQDLVAQCVEDVKTLFKNDQHVQVSVEGDTHVRSDAKGLRRVLLNLLSNAIKYSGEGTHVSVIVRGSQDELSVEVTDQGIGIPRSEQSELFERFFRASNASVHRGTGLGLNIVKRYLDLLEGRIEFTSELNKGSSFKVTIPKKLSL